MVLLQTQDEPLACGECFLRDADQLKIAAGSPPECRVDCAGWRSMISTVLLLRHDFFGTS
jgi:hypothetical protein